MACKVSLRTCLHFLKTPGHRIRTFQITNNRLLARRFSTSSKANEGFSGRPSIYDQLLESNKTFDKNHARTTFANLQNTSADESIARLMLAEVHKTSTENPNLSLDITKAQKHEDDGFPMRNSDQFWNSFSSKQCEKNAQLPNPYNEIPPYDSGVRHYSTQPQSPQPDQNSKDSKPEEPHSADVKSEEISKKSKKEQLKIIFAQYGAFGVAFHIAISLTSLGFFYLLVSSGIDVIGLLAKMGIELSSVVSGASTFVIAYTVHKLAMPVRVSITVVSVPILVRYLRRIGLFRK